VNLGGKRMSVAAVETIEVVTLCWGKLCESYDSVLFCTPSQTSQPYARESINNPLQGELYATPLSCHTWGGELIWRHKEFLFCEWEPKYRLTFRVRSAVVNERETSFWCGFYHIEIVHCNEAKKKKKKNQSYRT
jgi:hypothetical protein